MEMQRAKLKDRFKLQERQIDDLRRYEMINEEQFKEIKVKLAKTRSYKDKVQKAQEFIDSLKDINASDYLIQSSTWGLSYLFNTHYSKGRAAVLDLVLALLEGDQEKSDKILNFIKVITAKSLGLKADQITFKTEESGQDKLEQNTYAVKRR